MNKILTLTDTARLVNTVVDTVFIETDGVMDFHPEYLEIAKVYYKVWYYVPEMIVDGDTISEFYEKYINGEYDETLANYVDIKQSKYIDNAIDSKIEYKKNQISNPVSTSIARLCNAVADVAESSKDNFTDVDVKKFVDGLSSLGDKFDTEKAVQMILDKNKKPDGTVGDATSKEIKIKPKKTTKKGE